MQGVGTDYIVTAVNYDETSAQIVYVFVGIPPDKADRTVDGIRLYTREQLLEALKKQRRFFVATRNGQEWSLLGEIRAVAVGGREYLRLDSEAVAVDDLGRLAKIRSTR
jgi:hypothetical protein